jgi:hypothetical protein
MILIMIGSSQDLNMVAQIGEYHHLDTAMDYSRITPEAGMAMKKASGDDSPLRQGARKSFRTLPN